MLAKLTEFIVEKMCDLNGIRKMTDAPGQPSLPYTLAENAPPPKRARFNLASKSEKFNILYETAEAMKAVWLTEKSSTSLQPEASLFPLQLMSHMALNTDSINIELELGNSPLTPKQQTTLKLDKYAYSLSDF